MNFVVTFSFLLSSLSCFVWVCTAKVLPANTGGDASFGQIDRTSNHLISHEVFSSLEELARIVDISYCVGSTGVHKPFECLSHCREFKGFELLTTWHTGPLLSDSCGYVAISHGRFATRIIVAFRGTYSIANTVVDLSAYPQSYVPYNAGGDKGGDLPNCVNCTVHAGFMRSWQNARSTVLQHVSAARDRYPDHKVLLVGHSLGGAVAALAGIEMKLRGWETQVTTFGEPKVGNKQFVRFLDEVFDLGASSDDRDWNFRRVTHINDPVPLLPLQKWGYEMHAGEIFISKTDLLPSISDVVLCDGDSDMRCVSGAEEIIDSISRATSLMLGDLSTPTGSTKEQMLLSDRSRADFVAGWFDENGERQFDASLPWHLIPAKYRLWQLFISHRDYFWRLGLCIPGGDPTGRG